MKVVIAIISIIMIGTCFAGELKINGTFAPDKANKEMPLNWSRKKGKFFKPYGKIKYLAPDKMHFVSNSKTSIYFEEKTLFPIKPYAEIKLSVFAKGKGMVGFIVHVYGKDGKWIYHHTSAIPAKKSGRLIKTTCKLKGKYSGQVPEKISLGIFIQKNADVTVSNYKAEYIENKPNAALIPVTRTDWAAGTYKMLTKKAEKEKNIKIMFLGDSITQLWGFSKNNKYPGGLEVWNKYFKAMGAENYGVSGDMIQNILWRITTGKQLSCTPGVIVLLAGTNNLHQQPVASPKEINQGIDKLISEIQKKLPKTEILLVGILPRKGKFPIKSINKMLSLTARKHKIRFLDASYALLGVEKVVDAKIFRDGIHLSPAGYEIFAQTLLPEIQRLIVTKENKDMALPAKKSRYKIYLAKDAITPERKAAEEFRYFFAKAYGETPEIVHTLPADILIGQSKEVAKLLPEIDFAKLKNDEIILRKKDGKLILTGDRPRGSLYAVYTFLEDYVGVTFYSSFAQDVPHKKNFKIPSVNIRYSPVIKARGAFFHDLVYTDQLFAIRLRNSEDFLKGKSDYGCEINFPGGAHTFDRFLAAKKYLKTNPDFFSLRGKKRIGGQTKGQLCLTNKKMRAELTKNLFKFLRHHPKATLVSVSQNDNTNKCECASCSKEIVKMGASGQMLRFVNQVAEDVEKEFPKVNIQTFAYQYTSAPPKTNIRPRNNVEIRLCSIGANFATPLDSDGNASFRKELKAWSKIAPKLSIWNYVTNFSNYQLPYPNLNSLADDIRFFGQNNVSGVFEQGDWNSGGVTGDFVALKAYVISKLLWDPSLDSEKLVDKFLNGYYKEAAPYIKKYLDLIHDEVVNNKIYLACFVDHGSTVLTLESMLDGYKLMKQARDAVKNADFKIQERVAVASLPIRFALLERAVPLKKKYGSKILNFNKLLYDTLCISKRNRTIKYQEAKSIDRWEKIITESVKKANSYVAVKIIPAKCSKSLKKGSFWDIQDTGYKQVADSAASDGFATRMPGTRYTWMPQFHPDLDTFPMKSGKYRLVATIRAELNQNKLPEERGAECGSYNRLTKKMNFIYVPLKDIIGSQYKEIDLGVHYLDKNCYIYTAPRNNPNMKYLFIDRITAIKVD